MDGFPLVIRQSPWLGCACLLLGVLMLGVTALVGFGSQSVLNLILGVLFLVLGTGFLLGKPIIVEPHEVALKNALGITMRRIPINGLADLVLDGKKLVRAGDGKRIAVVGFGFRAADRDQLAAAISAAGGAVRPRR